LGACEAWHESAAVKGSRDRDTTRIPVLLYHSISDDPTQDERFAVSRTMFEAHAHAIEASGLATLAISEPAPPRAVRSHAALAIGKYV
jgi:hypothetical protein